MKSGSSESNLSTETESTETESALLKLPPELLFAILFLLPPEKIQKIIITCKDFYEISTSDLFWKEKHKQHFGKSETYGLAQFWQKYKEDYQGFSDGIKKIFSAVKENDLPRIKKLVEKHKLEINDLLTTNKKVTLIQQLTSNNTHQEIRNYFYETIIEPLSSKTGVIDKAENTVLIWLFLLRQPVNKIKEFIEKNSTDINSPNLNDTTPLILAINRQDLELVMLLLHHGADVNQVNGLTPLTCAVQNGDMEIMKELIENGKAQVNLANTNGITPLIIAAAVGNLEAVQLLLEKGALLDAVDCYNASPLYFAADGGNRKIVQLFIEMGADVNANTSDGDTPLSIAAHEGHLTTVEELLNNGANINGNPHWGTPLFFAVQQNHPEIVKLLLARGALDLPLSFTISDLNMLIESDDETAKGRMKKFIDSQTSRFFGFWRSHVEKLEINALDLAHILSHQEIITCLEPEEEPGPFCKVM